jgi:raffinose/stachyose/melibiose transport system substrate-binding protein
MDGITYQVYRVKGEFRERFNFKDYPFDTQKLAIRFRHTTKTRNDIIYVVDLVGLGEPTGSSITAKLIRNKILGSITDWKIKKVDVFQNISKEESSLGDPKLLGSGSILNYSTFNAVIEIKRDTLSFVIKNLLPLLFLVGISYFLLFLPFEQITATAISGTLVAIAFFHLGLANGLPSGIGYAVALDYAFYLIYGLIILQFLLVVIGQHVSESQLKHVSLTGQIAYPIILLTGICFFVYYYSENGEIALSRDSNVATDSVQLGKQNPKTSHSKTTPEDSVVLTLGSWLSKYVYVEQMNNHILTAFQTKYPHIQIEFQPFLVLEYDSTLDFHFKNQSAPDIVFLRPFSQQYLFEEGYLESLGKVPNIKKNIPLIIHTPWNSNNYLYGVPLMAVSHAIYYNMDIFKELELEVPKTWEELLVTAQTLKKAGYTPFANGLKTSWAAPVSIFMNLAPNFIGGQAGRAEYLSGQRCFNDEQVVAAFQAVVDIAPFLPNNPETINVRASQELFLTGKAAMLMDGSWEIPYFEQKQPHFKWSVFAVPAPAGQPQYVTYHPDFAIGLNKNSPHKEEAMLFLTWLTQPETVKLFSDKLPGFFPLNQKLLPTLQNKHAQAFLDLNQGRGTDIRWVSEKLMDSIPSGYDLMSEGTKAVIRGEKTPQEAANALQDGLAQWFKPAQTCLKK